MNERQGFLRRTVVPSVVTTTIGVTITLFLQGNSAAAGAALLALALLAGVYALFLWLNPRLGFLLWLWIRQWQLLVALLLLVLVTVWALTVPARGRWVISAGPDIAGVLWLTVLALVLANYGVTRLAPLIRPGEMPGSAGHAALAFAGKTQDRTGRGHTGPDGHADAEFELEFHFGSSAERRSLVLVVLRRVSQSGRRLGEVWTSETLPSLWTLAVLDGATGMLLNPDGRLTLGSVQNGTVLRLFASDRSDDDSDWFVAGQHYVATAYLAGGLFMTATAVLA